MLILKGKREEILNKIKDSTVSEEEVKILSKPSKKLFFYLLTYLPNIKRIYVSEGIFKTISKRLIAGLKNASIDLIVFKTRRGRAEVFPSSKKQEAIVLLKQGLKAKEISSLVNLPISTIYMLRKKLKKSF
ncbi:MAG: hypothetical protein N3D10_03825 [Candidatus Micrarchaeota archaeon]|nr:hypothetical protein [Candidatus Micrarchaeota archaeon]